MLNWKADKGRALWSGRDENTREIWEVRCGDDGRFVIAHDEVLVDESFPTRQEAFDLCETIAEARRPKAPDPQMLPCFEFAPAPRRWERLPCCTFIDLDAVIAMSYRVITDTHNIEAMFIMNGGANFVREMTIEQFQFIAKQIYPGFEG